MAPRRGGGGSSSGGSSISSCPGAFLTTESQVYFASDAVFFVVFLAISLAFCLFRKKALAGKKLIGVPFIFALFFMMLSYACSIVATVLNQCGTTDRNSYYDWQIPISIFYRLSLWLLLVVFVWTLGTMLHEQRGKLTAVYKILYLAMVGLLGVLTCAQVGLSSYNYWASAQYEDTNPVIQEGLRTAYYALYMVVVLIAGGLAIATIMSLRKIRHPAGDLLGWVIALTISMLLWVIIDIVFGAMYLQQADVTFETNAALVYLSDFAQALSFVFILCIAKHTAWGYSAETGATFNPEIYREGTQHQQYAPYAPYTQPNGQVYYYPQTQGYHTAPELVK